MRIANKHCVQVLASVEGEDKLASGFEIRPGVIVTARHLVYRNGAASPLEAKKVRVRFHDKREVVALTIHDTSERLDVVLLELCGTWERNTRCWLPPNGRYNGQCVAVLGYAIASRERPQSTLLSHVGNLCPWDDEDAPLCIAMQAPPDDWTRICGSPVLIDGRLCAVAVGQQSAYDGKLLRATAVSQLLKNDSFCSLLGLNKTFSPLENRLCQILHGADEVLECFAAHLKAPADVVAVAEHLLSLESSVAASEILNVCGVEERYRRVGRKILNALMPATSDIRSIAKEGAASLPQIEVPGTFATLAECVVAAALGREAEFEPGTGAQPEIPAALRMPSTVMVSLSPRSSVGDELTRLLERKLGLDMLSLSASELSGRLRATLKRRSEGTGSRRPSPLYCLYRSEAEDLRWQELVALAGSAGSFAGLLAVRQRGGEDVFSAADDSICEIFCKREADL